MYEYLSSNGNATVFLYRSIKDKTLLWVRATHQSGQSRVEDLKHHILILTPVIVFSIIFVRCWDHRDESFTVICAEDIRLTIGSQWQMTYRNVKAVKFYGFFHWPLNKWWPDISLEIMYSVREGDGSVGISCIKHKCFVVLN